MKKNLQNLYNEWRIQIIEENKFNYEHGGSNPVYGSIDFGELSVRKDFSYYSDLDTLITFEEMQELENNHQ